MELLGRPLKFGDTGQIAEIRRQEKEYNIRNGILEPGQKKYIVTFNYSGGLNYEVIAHSKEEAKELANDKFSTDDIEIDDSDIGVIEIK